MVSYALLSNLLESNLACCASGFTSKNSLPNQSHKDLLCFFLGHLVSTFTFRSREHLELISVYGVR